MQPTTLRPLALALVVSSLVAPLAAQGSLRDKIRRLPINDGGLTVDDFDYDDPYPPGFQPLGHPTLAMRDRSEAAIYMPLPTAGFTEGWVVDDPAAGFSELDDAISMHGFARVRTAAAGQLDDDAADELVTVTIAPGGALLLVETFDQDANGDMDLTSQFTIPASGWNFAETRLALGDVDGDQRDELILTARATTLNVQTVASWMRVYDDPFDGSVLQLHFDYLFENTDIQPGSADLDGDGRHEVVLMGENSIASHGDLWLRAWTDGADANPYAPIGDWFRFEDNLGDGTRGVMTTGDYDLDGTDEICLTACTWVGNGHPTIRVMHGVELSGNALVSFGRTVANLGAASGGNTERDWDACNLNRGTDQVATLTRHGSKLELEVHAWDANANQWTVVEGGVPVFTISTRVGVTLSSADFDSDGVEELIKGLVRPSTPTLHTLYTYTVEWEPSFSFQAIPQRQVAATTTPYPPVLVGGDFDADGLVLESTGEKFLTVADPVPLVLMAAPPTKAGISQNYDDSETYYEEVVQSSESVGVSVSSAVSAYVGLSAEDLLGIFELSGGVRFEEALEATEVSTTSVSYSSGYATSAADDTIVFQGTLFQNYEYEVIASPDLNQIGERLLVSLPVATSTYKWTIDYYNASVSPEYLVPRHVFQHAVGAPYSYPSFADVQSRMATNLGWLSPSEQTVGQGSATTNLGISLATEQTTEEERTFSTSLEAGFSVGPVDVEASFTVGGGESYSVTFGEENSYQGVVGDIQSPSDWQDWAYGYGLSVYHHGVDAAGNPIPGQVPIQVVGYWVE